MKKTILMFLAVLATLEVPAAINGQYSFEKTCPAFITVKGGGKATISPDRFKDGRESLEFTWLGQAELSFNNSAELQASMEVLKAGMMFWVYSPEALGAPLRFTFWNAEGQKICWFDFHMDFRGWRTAWIRYDDMRTESGYWADLPFAERDKNAVRMTVTTPPSVPSGKIWLDRLSFRTVRLHDQITPDQQLPDNNKHLSRRAMWHWCRTWEWSQYPELRPVALSVTQQEMVDRMIGKLDDWSRNGNPSPQYTEGTLMPRVEKMLARYGLHRRPDGTVAGQPLLSDDEYNNARDEMRISFIQDIVYWCALDYLYTGNPVSVETAMLAMDHAIEQGFAYGSGQGTNHHYGYQVRNLYKGIWILRKELAAAGKLQDYEKVLTYWSGIGEVRKPLEGQRDEILDSWHTLQMAKVISALLQEEDGMKYAYMKALTDWTGKTMRCTDGTLGGFKADGTSFHHGGHYPAYAVGAFAELGLFCELIRDTDLVLDLEGRRCMKRSLLALQNYCQVRDWGFGVCGRHPFGGHIPEADVAAYARLALLGDLREDGHDSIDPDLAGAYLALEGKNKEYKSVFKKLGIRKVSPADGFTVYNYGAFGIHRREGWMLTLKGYNTDVWASEIYTHDNRYGRYLSYGSVQLIEGDSAEESGYVQDGWDWNRIPGVTAVHLPFDLLESPNKGTLMERNDSRFPGVSSLEGRNGCLAFTYVEKDRPNFCAGATATKSVFCFDNRIVHVGTGISNDAQYPTETVLFQTALESENVEIDINDFYTTDFPYAYERREHGPVVLTDVKDNYYIIRDGCGLNVEKKLQASSDDTKKKTGRGAFASAWINHGIAPKGASYEYLLLVKPTMKEVSRSSRKLPYKVLQADNVAHVVKDVPTGITAYVSYGGYGSKKTTVAAIEAETIVMERMREDGSLVMSICTPDLGITEKAYTTPQASQPLIRTVTLNGNWKLAAGNSQVKLSAMEGQTEVMVTCLHGQPVEFVLVK